VINELGVEDTDSLLVFNKIDKIGDPEILEAQVQRNTDAICVSSKIGSGLDILRNAIVKCYESKLTLYRVNIDYEHARVIPQIRKHVVIVNADYEANFIRLHLRMPPGGKEKVNEILRQAKQHTSVRRE